ncbi:MAG TPA: oligosaccharide flippase family protein, partial [Candidatus Baltobacteraceae bacterium]|nr:oligosaccharide flippase family protein [Candidatus Baltobacteraceae bacterium]
GQVGFANVQGLLNALLLTLAAAILCFGLHLHVEAMLAAWVAVNAAITVYSLLNMRKYKGPAGTPQERAQALREHTSFGLKVTVNQLLGLLNYQVDIFIVLFVLGHASLGRYSIAVGVGMMMWQLSRPLSVASYGSVTRGSAEAAARITVLCVRHALFNVGIACAVLVFIGPWLLHLVYGPAFDESGRALQLLLPGIIAYCTVPFFSQYFTLQMGKPGLNTLVTATSTAVCAAVTFALIHRFGIAAGAIGTSVSYTAGFIICVTIFCKNTGTAPSGLFAFGMHDLRHYGTLLTWIFSGMRSTYVRRGG